MAGGPISLDGGRVDDTFTTPDGELVDKFLDGEETGGDTVEELADGI